MAVRTCVTAAGVYCGMGLSLPVPATVSGLIGVFLVRALLWSRKESVIWNIAVMGLAMMATFTTAEGSTMSPFYGFWMGVGYGGMGVGIIGIGRNLTKNALGERFKKAGEVLFGLKFDKPPEDELPPTKVED